MLNYEKLSDEISARIKNDRENGFAGNLAFNEVNVIRRDSNKDKANIIRTALSPDVDFMFSWYHVLPEPLAKRWD